MRLSLFAVATACALAAFSSAEDNKEVNAVEQVLDAFGKPFEIIDSGGDLDDDDENPSSGLARRKHHHKHSRGSHKWNAKPDEHSKRLGTTQITWYASHDLLNPQCGDGSWQPTNSNHIGAVMKGWNGGPKCGEFVLICNKHAKGGDRCVKVRVVDKCAGCGEHHVDLTKSAFKRLSPSGTLREGRIGHLDFFSITTPNPFDKGLWGPFRLKH